MSQYRTFLGVDTRIPEAMAAATVRLAPVSHTTDTIIESANRALREAQLAPGSASKLRGQMGWSASNSFGRCGRLSTSALKDRQYGHTSHMTDRLRSALRFAITLATDLPPPVT